MGGLARGWSRVCGGILVSNWRLQEARALLGGEDGVRREEGEGLYIGTGGGGEAD